MQVGPTEGSSQGRAGGHRSPERVSTLVATADERRSSHAAERKCLALASCARRTSKGFAIRGVRVYVWSETEGEARRLWSTLTSDGPPEA